MTGVINSDVKPPDWKREAKSYLADGPPVEKGSFLFLFGSVPDIVLGLEDTTSTFLPSRNLHSSGLARL